MSKNIHVAASPLTGTIYAGHIVANGTRWGANKIDVTVNALVAVANHALIFSGRNNGSPIVISKADGTPEFEITVKKL